MNNVSSTPFKINTVLLDFILNNKHLNLLIDINLAHKYDDQVRTKHPDKVYKSCISIVLSQENILDIASIYRN